MRFLGPCRCQGCGETVWWESGLSMILGNLIRKTRWREEDGASHRCPGGLE